MKVIKNYLYNMSYQILVLLAPLITVPYVARVLGSHGVGVNSYTNSWITFFLLLGQMGIALYGNREIAYHRDNKLDRSKIFWEIEILQALTIMFAYVVFLIFLFRFSHAQRPFFLIQSLLIVAGGLDVSWYFMGMEDFKKTVLRNAVIKIVSIALIFALVKGPDDLGRYILLLGMSQVVGNLTLWPYLKESVQFIKISILRPFKHFYPALLLFIPTITTQVYLVVNRIMLGRLDSIIAAGQFDYADKITKLVLAVVTATGSVMLPHIAHKFADGDVRGIRQSLYNSFDFVTALAVPMMFGLAAISTSFAPWFLGNEFAPTAKIMFIESPAIVLIAWSNVTGTQYLMPVNRVKEFTASVAVGAAVNIVCNLFLIEVFGANGAALATVISEFVVTALQIYFIRTTIRRRQLFKYTWKYIVSGGVMFIVVYRLNSMMHMNLTNLIIQVIIGSIIYIICIFFTGAPIIAQLKNFVSKK
ncbi:flippase [Paucilactobacillus kaifaensis]|uniref:flippase n=1 Tax=Paucilactobacillus kaifaensis TaxID=2559921 RepID=UPI0010F8B5E7|nr:flippase [Paucilactobacillus kaifaensis]